MNSQDELSATRVQLEFDFGGTQSADALAAVDAAQLHASELDQIAIMINDRRTPVWIASRLIAVGIAGVIKSMQQTPVRRAPPYNNQIKAYRALQRTLTGSTSSVETLKMDGPQFQFVFTRIVDLFQRAVWGVNRPSVRVVELIAENHESLRRRVELMMRCQHPN